MREEEKNRSSQWKTFFKKRWVFPAVYLVAAALLISTIVWYQAGNNSVKEPNVAENGKDLTGKNNEEPVVEVNQSFENVVMPVKNDDEVVIKTGFFDANASEEDQEAALIVDGNKYRPNTGLDIANKDGKEFEVVAALSGKVASVRQDALLGNVIEVEHEKGIVTIYQSVKDMKVKSGDSVKQGDVLATSSTSQLNMAAKNHVHFEIRKDDQALNPQTYFGQSLTVLSEVEVDDSKISGQIESGEGSENVKDTEDTGTEDTGSDTELELE
ncbi:M23 family metallopeptidase [Bacillus sp. FJAT-49711]|uniref:M23 family metallopeptidase n=1 Tax=Bacillus sp. FJAT-49711 TaxID=2833585 RepID=UPI001BC9C2D0|nr:M23 family metallopeptidase [Bacillus sp. FJAT-49711]MBS4218919.1 M23 family metallopeptidase [Bacillus sp. FJAT-49711]